MLKVTYCTTQDGMGRDTTETVDISLLKGVTLFSHYSKEFDLIDTVCDILNINNIQLIRISF